MCSSDFFRFSPFTSRSLRLLSEVTLPAPCPLCGRGFFSPIRIFLGLPRCATRFVLSASGDFKLSRKQVLPGHRLSHCFLDDDRSVPFPNKQPSRLNNLSEPFSPSRPILSPPRAPTIADRRLFQSSSNPLVPPPLHGTPSAAILTPFSFPAPSCLSVKSTTFPSTFPGFVEVLRCVNEKVPPHPVRSPFHLLTPHRISALMRPLLL